MIYALVLLLATSWQVHGLDCPKIDQRPPAADYSYFQNRLSSASFSFDAAKIDGFQMDFRSCNLSSYDLEKNPDMLYSSFNTKTIFPHNLPANFKPGAILAFGKDPGLGVAALHRAGITGRGVGVAILDQALLTEHVEYADRLRLYEEIHCRDGEASMHGPAVASIAVGKTVGVAPGADLYFICETNGESINGKFVMDLDYAAQGIDRIIEINKSLPSPRRIRVISISLGMVRDWRHYDQALSAIERAENAGILVLTVENEKYPFDGMGRSPLADPSLPTSYSGGLMFCGNQRGSNSNILQIPMDSRTVADPEGPNEYFFSRVGGQSWIVPWVAGLYALACQVRPDITPGLFWKTALATAVPVKFERDHKTYTLSKVVQPVALIERLKAK